jgi:MarR family transcriptional regulator, lower aerobic nicotinate degradation pathway regulator
MINMHYDCPMTQPPKPSKNNGSLPTGALAFEGGTGYLLSRTGSLARRSWTRMLTDRNLTPHHYGILMTLDEAGPTGQQRLSALIGIDPRNLVPIIDGLADRGLLAREVDPTDRRRRVLALTDSGHAMVADLSETGAAMEDRFLRALEPAEQASLHQMLLNLLTSAVEDDH